MTPESYIGEKLVWLLGSLLLALVAMLTGQYVGAKDKITQQTCEERRASCVLFTSSKLDMLQARVEKMDLKIDKLIERD